MEFFVRLPGQRFSILQPEKPQEKRQPTCAITAQQRLSSKRLVLYMAAIIIQRDLFEMELEREPLCAGSVQHNLELRSATGRSASPRSTYKPKMQRMVTNVNPSEGLNCLSATLSCNRRCSRHTCIARTHTFPSFSVLIACLRSRYMGVVAMG